MTTPIEIAVYIASIANSGKIVVPRLVKTDSLEAELPSGSSASKLKQIDIPEEYFKTVKEGMRMAVTEGTAQGLSFPDLKIAAKTGTAEVGGKKISAIPGLSAFILTKIPSTPLLPWFWKKVHAGNTIGAPFAMKRFLTGSSFTIRNIRDRKRRYHK